MRNALKPSRADVPSALPESLPAPTGGWNARDALSAMPITDAEIMDNFFPETTDVRTRPGSLNYVTGLPGQVESAFSYAKGTSIQLLVACATTNQWYNVTTIGLSGTVAANSTVTTGTITMSNARWQSALMGNGVGGSFLVAVNGVDSAVVYNGTIAWSQTVATGGTSTIAAFTNLAIYNRRLFYTEKDTLRFLYHEQVNAIGGTVTPFDLSGLMSEGGYLIGIDTWTRDAGAGPDDYIAFISSRGEVAVYVGINPADATNWSMVGVYKIPAPLSYRCTQKMGGDLMIATEGGVYPLSEAVSGPLQQQAAITDKIRLKVAEAVNYYRANFGWELHYFPAGHWLVLNVPKTTGSDVNQFVMNTNTGAWCRFLGMQANCFVVFNNKLYFGANNALIQANVAIGLSVGDNGVNIQVDVKQAPSTFGLPGRLKQFKMFKPQIASDGDIPLTMGIDTDFSNLVPTNLPTPVVIPFATWDLNDWDTCYWADDPFPQPQWQGVTGIGTYGAIRLAGQIASEDIRWYGTDVILEPGEMV